jgi:hypothetical protein
MWLIPPGNSSSNHKKKNGLRRTTRMEGHTTTTIVEKRIGQNQTKESFEQLIIAFRCEYWVLLLAIAIKVLLLFDYFPIDGYSDNR